MTKTIRLDKASELVSVAMQGKIVQIDAIAGASASGVKVQLKKTGKCLAAAYEWVDQINTGTVDADATFTLSDGTVLYPVKSSGDIVGFRNGYYDLSWEDETEGEGGEEEAAPLMRTWTLTKFQYVEGVKTTVATWGDETEVESGFVDLTLTGGEDETDIVAADYDSEGDEVEDGYCTGSEYAQTGWEDAVKEVTIDLATITLTAGGSAKIAPKDGTTNLPYFADAGDTLVFGSTEELRNALDVRVRIEE